MDDDGTSKSSFETLETTLPGLAREDVIQQVQDECMDTVEVDLLANKINREDLRTDLQASFEEGSFRKPTQSSKFRLAKSLGIKNSKTLKRRPKWPNGNKIIII